MYSQIIKEGFLNLETVPEAKTLANRGTFHKRLTLMILHTGAAHVEVFEREVRALHMSPHSPLSGSAPAPKHR